MAAVIHSGKYRTWFASCMYPYERNKKSLAYIALYEGNYHYYTGSLNGGTSKTFIEFAEECSKRTIIDYDNNIIAIVHDESHLNKYMRDIKGEGLSTEYAYPE